MKMVPPSPRKPMLEQQNNKFKLILTEHQIVILCSEQTCDQTLARSYTHTHPSNLISFLYLLFANFYGKYSVPPHSLFWMSQ